MMESAFRLCERMHPAALRMSVAVVLGWIGALQLVSPQGVLDLLNASLPFLAFDAFVYLLGVAEVSAAALLVLGTAVIATAPRRETAMQERPRAVGSALATR